MTVRCFMVRRSGMYRVSLRRFSSSSKTTCHSSHGYHSGHYRLGEFKEVLNDHGYVKVFKEAYPAQVVPDYDPRWPSKCDHCDYLFTEEDARQHFTDSIYVDGCGNEYSLNSRTPGMMWDANWMHDWEEFTGPDGLSLHVICPDGGEWCIDGRASNCDSPCEHCGKTYAQHKDNQACGKYKDVRPHKCWVRHGTPPNITVDKNGITCGAGAGSIMSHNGYHGFLRDGQFT